MRTAARTSGYRIGNHAATYHQVQVGKLQSGDLLYAISKQDRVAHVIESVTTEGDLVSAQVTCCGKIRVMTWHKSARLAVLRLAA